MIFISCVCSSTVEIHARTVWLLQPHPCINICTVLAPGFTIKVDGGGTERGYFWTGREKTKEIEKSRNRQDWTSEEREEEKGSGSTLFSSTRPLRLLLLPHLSKVMKWTPLWQPLWALYRLGALLLLHSSF